MNSYLRRALAALVLLTFVLAACASDGGAGWTAVPLSTTADVATTVPAESVEPSGEATEVPTAPAATEPVAEITAEPGDATAEPQPEQSPAEPPGGEARVIAIEATGALQFLDAEGGQLSDIPVTPGETVIFRVDNTANFPHNFYIGEDAELSVPGGTTDTGIPDWDTGVQELKWVVPEDVSNLKFGCTFPGHYTVMQGTFSVAPGGEAPGETPAESAVPAAASGEARVIDLEATATIRFNQDGQDLSEIPVTPGETVIFRVDNTANFPHNFYIGEDAELSVPGGTTDTGIPDWSFGVQELKWVVPEDISNLRFACTFPGHYMFMQGDFVLAE